MQVGKSPPADRINQTWNSSEKLERFNFTATFCIRWGKEAYGVPMVVRDQDWGDQVQISPPLCHLKGLCALTRHLESR